MKSFRTELADWPSSTAFTHADGVLCMGSCFAEHIGARLAERKFSTLTNPSGIIYNPVSLAQTLQWIAEGRVFSEADVFEHEGQWNSFYHHSRLSALSREALLEGINRQMEAAGAFFRKRTTRILLTLGTAMVYEHKERGEVVANCHKLPSSAFTRRRLSVEEVTGPLSGFFRMLENNRPDTEVILTLSPVRHLREGMVENQRSKAVLALAVAGLEEAFARVHYFPAYELLLDDLRDYRFYAEDLVHPNAQAIDYIWDFFSRTYFPKETQQVVREVEEILSAARHRPFQPDSPAHQAFREKQLQKIGELEKRYPFLDFGEERRAFGKGN